MRINKKEIALNYTLLVAAVAGSVAAAVTKNKLYLLANTALLATPFLGYRQYSQMPKRIEEAKDKITADARAIKDALLTVANSAKDTVDKEAMKEDLGLFAGKFAVPLDLDEAEGALNALNSKIERDSNVEPQFKKAKELLDLIASIEKGETRGKVAGSFRAFLGMHV